MEDKKILVRYSQLDPNALKKELAKRYKLEEPLSCRFFDSGMNDIYVVKAGKQCYYLRISQANVHSHRDYEEEVFIINTLCKNGVNAVAPICCSDGSFVWEINAPEGKRYAVLFTEAKQIPSENKIKKAYNLGRMAANMHTIADKENFKVSRCPIDLIQLAKKPLKMIKPHLEHRPLDYEFLSSAAEKLYSYVEKNFSYEKPYYGYCHGDIHSGNVFFQGDKPEIFDFDCMGYGWRAYDICVFAWNETFDDEKYAYGECFKAFLDGYNSVRKLTQIELQAINVFAALRELWMMGIHAEVMERNAGCSWYNDGYFDYQIKIFKLWYERAKMYFIAQKN